MRLETRFTPPDPGARPGTPGAKWKLRVRVEPDAIAMPVPPSPATKREADLVERCWTDARGDLSTPRGARAFADFTRMVGPARGAWLLRNVEVDRHEGGFAAVKQHDRTTSVPPPLVGLPRRLEIWGGPPDSPRRMLRLTPDRNAIAAQAGLAAVKPKRDGQIPRTWWNSYDAARKVGLAGRIVLGEQKPFFKVLLCVGLGEPDGRPAPEALFALHTKAGRLGTLPPLSPTNSVDGRPAADTGKDPAAWLDLARLPRPPPAGCPGCSPGSRSSPVCLRPTSTGTAPPTHWCARCGPCCGNAASRTSVACRRRSTPSAAMPDGTCTRSGRCRCCASATCPTAYSRSPTTTQVARGQPEPRLERAILRALDHLTPALAAAAGREPPLVGAGEEDILRVLSKVPTAREYGTRDDPATVMMASIIAALGGQSPTETIAEWDRQAALLLDLQPAPWRRHSPAFEVQPGRNGSRPSGVRCWSVSSGRGGRSWRPRTTPPGSGVGSTSCRSARSPGWSATRCC